MSRSIAIGPLLAKKGAAHRALSAEVRRTMAVIQEAGEAAPAGMLRALEAAHVGANKLISAAGRGDQVEIAITVAETPLGGWNASVLVDVPVPTYPERA